jgi:DNA-binding PadR family transcriptional regulator
LSSEIVERLQGKALRNFMDMLILAEMKKEASLSGYDIISFVHKKFGVFVSSGTVYSLLYSLERAGLIKGVWNDRKRVYKLSEKGIQNIEVITKANDEVQKFLRNLSLLNANSHAKPIDI